MTVLALLIIVGGIKTISKVSSVVVPVMAIFYVIAGLVVIIINYRKKDRQYANKLMENIHSIPELRDTIFWYDEYIITGKDFEKEIQNELNEADFMILLVTQNILEN